MRSLDNMIEMVQDEIAKMGDNGLKTTNIDMIYKLVDILKDLRTAKAMEESGEYSEYAYSERYPNYERENSYRGGRHYVRGHYSRNGENDAYARYMDSKKSYRYSQSTDCKSKMMDAIEDYMTEITAKLEDMMNDSDCAEERQTIQRYINKIKQM